ncbi:MAG: hypothetical protein F6K56_43435 [Moorea sp. SIO3G5]|nr:hypothetical protein [Moorena sp. SIO3G5]
MKRLSYIPLFSAIAFLPTVITAQVSYAQPSYAQTSYPQDRTFFCSSSDGVPATIAKTSRGEVAMVLWNSSDLGESDSTPQELCEEVSEKFQTYYNTGELNYITTGQRNQQTVACLAEGDQEPCQVTLFPINPEKPRVRLQRIFRIRVPSSGPIYETDTLIYVDLEKYLNGEYSR